MAGIISPWNYPLILTVTPITEAILAGNTVVLKPTEQTPLTVRLLKEIWDESTGENNVLQIIYGGGDVGSMLVNSTETDVICFTGSTKIGKMIGLTITMSVKKNVQMNSQLKRRLRLGILSVAFILIRRFSICKTIIISYLMLKKL